MRVLLVEDEPLAQEKLSDLIHQFDSSIEIANIVDSVEDSVNYLESNPDIDLLFLDVQLSDGLCFDIFKKVNVDKPVIFTTAYDQYALEAFKLNSVDYLLKPINFHDLEKSLIKYSKLKPAFSTVSRDLVQSIVDSMQKNFKKRFLVRVGNSMQFISTEEISYFLADDKTVYLSPKNRKDRFIIDHTLEELQSLLDPAEFYRINRKFIVRMDAIKAIHTYFNSRLILEMHSPCDIDIIISRERVSDFKNWLNS